jgi:hypothetical protein
MSEILVGQYLFERIKQLGVKSVFGVPGGKSRLESLKFYILFSAATANSGFERL